MEAMTTPQPLSAEELAEAIKLLPSVKRVHIEHTIASLETRLAQSSAELAVMRKALRKAGGAVWVAHGCALKLKAQMGGRVMYGAAEVDEWIDAIDDTYKLRKEINETISSPSAAAQELLAERDRLRQLVASTQALNTAAIKRAEAAEQQIAQLRATQRTWDQTLLDFANEVMESHDRGTPEYRLAEFVWNSRPAAAGSVPPTDKDQCPSCKIWLGASMDLASTCKKKNCPLRPAEIFG